MGSVETPAISAPIPADEQLRTALHHRYLDTYARLTSTNRHLRFVVFGLTLVSIGLIFVHVRTLSLVHHLRPLVVRIDEVGRAQAIRYDASTYTPREPEIRYFLSQFVTLHFSRMRATVRRDFAASLLFLASDLTEAVIDAQHQSQAIEQFLVSADPEVEINVLTVTLQELRTPPYRASVDYERVYFASNTHRELKRERYIATFTFTIAESVPNNVVPTNPLGVLVTYFREDQYFLDGSGSRKGGA